MLAHDTIQSVPQMDDIPLQDTYVRNTRCISIATGIMMTSSLNSGVQFESTIDPSATAPIQAPDQSHEPVYQSSAIAEPPLFGKQKVALPEPSRYSPWLLSLVYPLGRYLVLPAYFGRIEITGQENLPRSGPVILSPTHRSRWDAILVPFVAGHHVTGRHLRFMVSADEVKGLQGWFIRRLGGFPINTVRPAISSLRHGVELLEAGDTLVIFPEGNIFREEHVQPLKPGLARLAIQAEASKVNLGVKIVPITISYNRPFAPWRCTVSVRIGQPLQVSEYSTGCAKKDAKNLTAVLQDRMETLSRSVNRAGS